jgi:hypothetical protein
MSSTTVPVRISTAQMRQPFHGCEPGYIATTCHANCCRSSTSPTGTSVALLPEEEWQARARGRDVHLGLLQPIPGQHQCPEQQSTGLCGLHLTPDKPFGCIASPFILTSRDCLIVRNRYRLLKCYRDGDLPAYRAFATSLGLLFGQPEAERITAALEAGASGQIPAAMLDGSYQALRLLQQVRH